MPIEPLPDDLNFHGINNGDAVAIIAQRVEKLIDAVNKLENGFAVVCPHEYDFTKYAKIPEPITCPKCQFIFYPEHNHTANYAERRDR